MDPLFRKRSRILLRTSPRDGCKVLSRFNNDAELSYVPLVEQDGYEDQSDYNNRRDDRVHLSKEAKVGYVDGYDFNSYRVKAEPDAVYLDGLHRGGSLSYRGYASCKPSLDIITILQFLRDTGEFQWHWKWQVADSLYSYYPRARTLLRPDLPKFDGLRELAELKDLPGLVSQTRDALAQLIKDVRTRSLRSPLKRAAQGHLAVQFGFLPIVSSARKFVELQRNITKRLSQLLKEDGQAVRRRRDLVTHKATRTTYSAPVPDWLVGNQFSHFPGGDWQQDVAWGTIPSATYSISATNSYRVWAVGTYRFHLPKGVKDLKYMKKLANRLAGFRFTPSILYDLMPWTWLVDWFTNLGDIVHMHDPGVGESGAYEKFFLMGEKRTEVNFVTTVHFQDKSGNPVVKQFPCRTVITHKMRSATGPFDYQGYEPQYMSARQLGILGALGITKFPKVFRK